MSAPEMNKSIIINGVAIDPTFAEAFPMVGTRIIVTARSPRWAMNAGLAFTGFATSVIGCGCEAGIEKILEPDQTPDGRPGVSLLLFAMGDDALKAQVGNRLGQTILTCPSTACFAGLEEGKKAALGNLIRYFGDGYQLSKLIDGKRFWRIPVMEGEFLCADYTYYQPAVGGGNLLILADDGEKALAACERAVDAMRLVPNVVLPFPGGVVRSGSKVGSKYKALFASSNDAFCPTLKGLPHTQLSPETGSVLEIVIDGLSFEDVAKCMTAGIKSLTDGGRESGVHRISAGNYGGNLGPYHFKLHELLP